MKRFGCFILALAICAVMCSCAANPKCEYGEISSALKEADQVYAYVYSENMGYDIDADGLYDMINGKWEKISMPDEFEKVLSITVGTQYEICFFEGGKAMVYSGYAGVFERDRQYYSCEINEELGEICSYIVENGEEVMVEE